MMTLSINDTYHGGFVAIMLSIMEESDTCHTLLVEKHLSHSLDQVQNLKRNFSFQFSKQGTNQVPYRPSKLDCSITQLERLTSDKRSNLFG
jgi:hypothetical protein